MTETKFTPEEEAKLNLVIKDIEAVEKEGGLHPIQRKLFSLALQDDGVTWLHELPEGAAALIWAALDELKGTNELPAAVFTVIRVSTYMDHVLKLGKLAYQVYAVGNDAVVKYGLLKNVSTKDLEAGKKDAAIRTGTGGRDKAVPAKVGEEKPGVRIDQLPGGKRRI